MRYIIVLLSVLLMSCSGGNKNPPDGATPDAPAAPSGLTLYPYDAKITVTWNQVNFADSYNIYIASESGVTKNNFSTLANGAKYSNIIFDPMGGYAVSGLLNGVTYYLVMTAVNADGESIESTEYSATPLAVPDAPVGFNGSAGSGEVVLNWDAVIAADFYNIYRSTEPGLNKTNYSTIEGGVKTSGVTSPLVISGLNNEQKYYFVITAENALTESVESLTLVAIPGASGWVWQNPTPTGNDLWAVDFVDTLNGWIVGNSGTLLHTTNGGASWVNQWSGADINFADVSAIDANTAWVTGNKIKFTGETAGFVMHTTDAGATWTLHATPAGGVFSAVYFISASTGWVVGDTGIYHTADGGKTWLQQSTVSANDVMFIDASTGWVVAGKGTGGTVYKTVDGGASWSSQSLGTNLTGVDFLDSNTGFIVDYITSAAGDIYGTTNSGASWGALPTTANLLHDIAFGDPAAGWVVGSFGKIIFSSTAGASWITQSSGVTNHLYGVEAYGATHAWAVGSGGTILHTSNAGTTWTQQNTNPVPTSSGLSGIEFVDSLNGWAVGRAILSSSDGGVTWLAQKSGLSDSLHDVDFVNATTGWAVGDGSQIYSTTNGGTSWLSQNSNGASQLWGVSFVDVNNGWAVGPSGVIRRTSNGGLSWLAQTSGTGNVLYNVHFVNTNIGWIAAAGGVILYTDNGGTSWGGQISGSTSDITDIFALDSSKVWAVDGSSNVLATSNGGTNWNTIATLDFSPDRIYFVDSLNGWISGSDGHIAATNDGGVSWKKQSSRVGGSHSLRAISFINANTGWVAGGAGTGVIIKTTTGGF